MGEARRRKEADPKGYGRVPKNGRGVILCSPTFVDLRSGQMSVRGGLDPQELRLSLLFWDKIAWPTSNFIHIQGDGDVDFLVSEGVLSRPRIEFLGGGDGASIVVATQAEAFRQLEGKEPGSWAIAQGVNSLLVQGGVLQNGRSALVELTRAIPVPDQDVPLAEVLELKLRRRDELISLRTELDGFFSKIACAGDSDFELQRHVARIDAACSDLLKAGRGWGFPLRLSDVKASFEISGASLWPTVAGYMAGQHFQMPEVGALVGAALSTIKVSGDVVTTTLRGRRSDNPFRYVYSIHNELL